MSGSEETAGTASGPSAFITEAYSLGDKDGIISFYRKWAADYDAQMEAQGYCSPRAVSELLTDHLRDAGAEVLDVGCGTGLTGRHVADQGVDALDGIDISGEMIGVARSRDIYRRLVVGDLNEPLGFKDASYDAVVSSGTFTHGHVGPEPLHELVRILRPGGLLACTIHFDLWHTRGFDRTLATLIADGQLRCLSLHEGPFYKNGDNEGWFCLYQKP